MFNGIRIDRSKLISWVVLSILIMVIGVSAARAQGASGITTGVTGAANVQGDAHSKVVTPAKSYTLGLTGIPTVAGVGSGGAAARHFNGIAEDEHPKPKPKPKSPKE